MNKLLNVGEESDLQLTGFQKYSMLLICFLLYMINFMDKQVMAVVLEPMRIDLGFSDSTAGLMQTCFFVGMAVFSIPAAYLVDRWSRRKALSVMAIGWSGFTFLTGMGTGFWTVTLPRMVVGIGEAGFPAAATAMLTAAFPQKYRARIMGIFNMSIPIGVALGMVAGGVIAARTGSWRSPFLIFAIPGVILGIIAWFLKDYKSVPQVDASGKKEGFTKAIGTILKIPTVKWVALGYAMNLSVNTCFMVWMPTFVMRNHEIAVDKAAIMVGSIGLLGIIGTPLGGIVADVWQRRNVRGRIYTPIITNIVAGICFLGAIWFEMKGIGYVLAALWCTFTVAGIPAVNSISQDIVPPFLKGACWGTMGTIALALSAMTPSAIGILSDLHGGGAVGLKTAFFYISICSLSAVILLIIGARSYPADMDKVKGFVLKQE